MVFSYGAEEPSFRLSCGVERCVLAAVASLVLLEVVWLFR